jgi:F-type H+-transporting ATPase subunit delta
MDSRVAKRYARALFGSALKLGEVARVDEDLTALTDAMARDKRLSRLMVSPNVGRDEKLGILDRVFGATMAPLSRQFLRLALEKRRESEIRLVHLHYKELRREHENVLHATVTSALPMSQTERSALITKLVGETGRRVEADFDVDDQLIGGVKVAYGDYVLDGSVRGALDRMREVLVYDVLKMA